MTPALHFRVCRSCRAAGSTWVRRLLASLLAVLASAAAMAQDPEVLLSTSAGDIVLQLDPAHAPKTVDNFLAYVRSGHYDGTVFHRVIPGFMVQAGGYTAAMKEKPTRPPIALESGNGAANRRGTVAMARSANPNSATSQFFVNLVDNAALDAGQADDGLGYAVFGAVVSGMDVVDAIAGVATGTRGTHDDVPLKAVVIQRASVVR